MECNFFQRPVAVLVGLGLPTKIQSVQEAYILLNEWPTAARTTAHAVALNACKAALAGEIDAETARGTFLAFAERHDLLAPDMAGAIAARTPKAARPNKVL